MLEIEIGLIHFLYSTHISSCEIFVIFPDIDPYAEYRLKWRVDQPFGSFEITLIKGPPRRVPVFARFPSGNVRLIDEAWYHTAQYGKENLDSPVEIFFNPGSVIRFELVVYSGNRRFNCDMKYHLSVPDDHMDNTNFHIAAKRKGEQLPLNVPWMVGSELRSRIQRNYHLFEQDRPANDSK
ncbi:MAG: hypothetical protein VB959_05630 [Rhodospirillales bacterium]